MEGHATILCDCNREETRDLCFMARCKQVSNRILDSRHEMFKLLSRAILKKELNASLMSTENRTRAETGSEEVVEILGGGSTLFIKSVFYFVHFEVSKCSFFNL